MSYTTRKSHKFVPGSDVSDHELRKQQKELRKEERAKQTVAIIEKPPKRIIFSVHWQKKRIDAAHITLYNIDSIVKSLFDGRDYRLKTVEDLRLPLGSKSYILFEATEDKKMAVLRQDVLDRIGSHFTASLTFGSSEADKQTADVLVYLEGVDAKHPLDPIDVSVGKAVNA